MKRASLDAGLPALNAQGPNQLKPKSEPVEANRPGAVQGACSGEGARHEIANPGRPAHHAASRENACLSSRHRGHTAGFNRTLLTRSVIVSSACAATNVAEDGWAAELRRFSCAVRCLHTVASRIRAPRLISMT